MDQANVYFQGTEGLRWPRPWMSELQLLALPTWPYADPTVLSRNIKYVVLAPGCQADAWV